MDLGTASTSARETVDAVYREQSRRVFATLVRLLGDFDLAEEAMHDAFASAVEQWPREGVPANPRAWLVSAGRIKTAGIPYQVPSRADMPDRLDTVLHVIYLVFNEGYSASSGQELTRADLSGEAIRLGRLLVELLSEAEVMGLTALMLLQESRRA